MPVNTTDTNAAAETVGVEIPNDLHARLERLAVELDGFEDTAELLLFVLGETVAELENETARDAADAVDDDAIENRLEQLGYLE